MEVDSEASSEARSAWGVARQAMEAAYWGMVTEEE